jgi:hypothetical protein
LHSRIPSTRRWCCRSGRSRGQKGRQQGQNTGKDAWKSNFKPADRQEGKLQAGQHPHKDEPFGSTPGEVRGAPGGKKGQAKTGKRGTKNSVKAKSKAREAAAKKK